LFVSGSLRKRHFFVVDVLPFVVDKPENRSPVKTDRFVVGPADNVDGPLIKVSDDLLIVDQYDAVIDRIQDDV
jgi:hypothetical protein